MYDYYYKRERGKESSRGHTAHSTRRESHQNMEQEEEVKIKKERGGGG